MSKDAIVLAAGQITGRGRSINPFVILKDVAGFVAFAEAVFDADEVIEARTSTPTGELIHAELRVGDSLLLMADPQPGWPGPPGLFQIWVSDIETVVTRAVDRRAVVVTPPTPFYGSLMLARLEDPWGNLWWMYQPAPGQPDPKPAWEGGSDIIFRTLDQYLRAMPGVGGDLYPVWPSRSSSIARSTSRMSVMNPRSPGRSER